MAARRRRKLSAGAWPLGLAILLIALTGCSFRSERNPLPGFAKVGPAAERETGYQADLQIRQQLRLIDDPAVLAFVHELGQTLVESLGEQPFTYHFRVIEHPALNAFALPGGYIYFHSGTLLQASSLQEVAGVMAHEVAHVKGRHWARSVEQTSLPNLLTNLAGILTTVATGEPGAMMVSQGMNVALQLRFTREFEAEADQMGTSFMARSGFDPRGMAVFFERIVAEQRKRGPGREIPPYLFSHPDVELRIDGAYRRAEDLTVTGSYDPELEAAFRVAQRRLAMIVESDRSELRRVRPQPDRSITDPALEEARRLAAAGRSDEALTVLWAVADRGAQDPRVFFQIGELLEESGRPRQAIDAYRQALFLDPGVALAYYRVGLLYRQLDEPADAAFYLEQAERRFERGGALQKRTRQMIERLTFPVIAQAGLADGSQEGAGDTPAGRAREAFGAEDARVVWWGIVADHWGGAGERLSVRFLDPQGRVVQEEKAQRIRRTRAHGSVLELDPSRSARSGTWRVEVRFGDEVVDRREFELRAEQAPGRQALQAPSTSATNAAQETRFP